MSYKKVVKFTEKNVEFHRKKCGLSLKKVQNFTEKMLIFTENTCGIQQKKVWNFTESLHGCIPGAGETTKSKP